MLNLDKFKLSSVYFPPDIFRPAIASTPQMQNAIRSMCEALEKHNQPFLLAARQDASHPSHEGGNHGSTLELR